MSASFVDTDFDRLDTAYTSLSRPNSAELSQPE